MPYTVQRIDDLGADLIASLRVITDLFERGMTLRVVDGPAAGDHTEGSMALHLSLILLEDQRRQARTAS